MCNIINKPINYYYRKRLKKLISIGMVQNYIELSKLIKNADYDSIIVGSSHGEYGIKAEVLSDSNNKYLNCATTSQDLYRSYQLIKNISHIKEIKKVIMTYSLFSNGFVLDKTREGIKDCYLSDVFCSIPTRLDYSKHDYHVINYIKKYANTYPDKNNSYRNAFGDKIKYSFMDNIDIKERVLAHIKHNRRNSEENKYVEKSILYCRHNNIKLLILIMPVRQDYMLEVNNYDDYKTHYKDIIDIASKHNIPLLLYDNSEIIDYKDFGDCDHLTEQGAFKFSRILKKEINFYEEKLF